MSEKTEAEQLVESLELVEFAEALQTLLYKEFGHVLRTPETRGWYKAACGITVALASDPVGFVPGLTRSESHEAFMLPFEKIIEINGKEMGDR